MAGSLYSQIQRWPTPEYFISGKDPDPGIYKLVKVAIPSSLAPVSMAVYWESPLHCSIIPQENPTATLAPVSFNPEYDGPMYRGISEPIFAALAPFSMVPFPVSPKYIGPLNDSISAIHGPASMVPFIVLPEYGAPQSDSVNATAAPVSMIPAY